MRCSKCHSENDEDAAFCGDCGAPLVPGENDIPFAKPAPVVNQVNCPKCGTPNEEGSIFCDSCGSGLTPQASQPYYPASEPSVATERKTSWAWWLLPIFFTWLGGLIAWLVLRKDDNSKAKRLLWTGIGLAIFIIVLNIIIIVVMSSVMGYQFGIELF